MVSFIRGLVIGVVLGGLIGWMLRGKKQDLNTKSFEDEVENDPELIALRKERELEKQIENALDDLED